MARTPITPTAASDYLSFLNTVPTVTDYQYTPSFVAKDIDFKALDHNQADFISIYDKETDEANKSFQKVGEERNKILNMRADNAYQQQKLKGLQDTYGMNQLFDLNEEDFTNSSKIKSIENSTARLLSDKNTLEIMREQSLSDKFEKDHESTACTGKDANPLLCQMGREDLKKYKGDVDGSFSANALNASNYAPMDIDKSIKDDMSSIPDEKFLGGILDQKGYVLVPEMEKKSKALVTDILTTRLKEPRFVNNLKAMGYDTPEKMNQLMNEYANTYFKENLVKHSMKMRPTPRAASGGSGGAPVLTTASSTMPGTGFYGVMQQYRNELAANAKTPGAGPAAQTKLNNINSALADGAFMANAAFLDFSGQQNNGPDYAARLKGVMDLSGSTPDAASKEVKKIKKASIEEGVRLGNVFAIPALMTGDSSNPNSNPASTLGKSYISAIHNSDYSFDNTGKAIASNGDTSAATLINKIFSALGIKEVQEKTRLLAVWKDKYKNGVANKNGQNVMDINDKDPFLYYYPSSGSAATPTAKQPNSPINKPKLKVKDLLNQK